MSAFGRLLIGSCWCEILMVVLQALVCLLLVWALAYGGLLFSFLPVVGVP